jgi:hypothetical protein
MRTKKFDCIKMKRLGAAKVREQTATLTREQELHFWKKRSQHLRQQALQVKALPRQAVEALGQGAG